MKHFFKLVCIAAVLAAGIFIVPSFIKPAKHTTINYASILKGKS